MKIFGVQFDIVWEDKPANHAKVRALLEAERPEPGSLVVLPEMFATGFSMNVPGIDDTETRETQEFLRQTAIDLGVYLLGGVVTRHASGRGLNQSVVYDPNGAAIARYDKIFPFTPGGELDHYAPGDRLSLFSWGEFTVAQFVCYDLRFPEIFRAAAMKGASLYTVIASWPEAREAHWVALLQARAIENQAYVIGVNRCGRDPKFNYTGRSLIVDPQGEILADAGNGEGVIRSEVDRASLDSYRQALPFLKDLRPEFLLPPTGTR